jgi:hypothetical protein
MCQVGLLRLQLPTSSPKGTRVHPTNVCRAQQADSDGKMR